MTLYKFKVYNVDLIHLHITNSYTRGLVSASITLHNYHSFFVVRIFKSHSFNNF